MVGEGDDSLLCFHYAKLFRIICKMLILMDSDLQIQIAA